MCIDCGGKIKKIGALRCLRCNGRHAGKKYGHLANAKITALRRRKRSRTKRRNSGGALRAKYLLMRLDKESI
jgi:hypothetical protein